MADATPETVGRFVADSQDVAVNEALVVATPDAVKKADPEAIVVALGLAVALVHVVAVELARPDAVEQPLCETLALADADADCPELELPDGQAEAPPEDEPDRVGIKDELAAVVAVSTVVTLALPVTVHCPLAVSAPLKVGRGLLLPTVLPDGEDVAMALALSELLCDGDAVLEFDAREDADTAGDADGRRLSVVAPVVDTHALMEKLDDGDRVARGEIDSSADAVVHDVARGVLLEEADCRGEPLAEALPHADGSAETVGADELERALLLVAPSGVTLTEVVCEPRPPALDEAAVDGESAAVDDGDALPTGLCEGAGADGDATLDADAPLDFDAAGDDDEDAL